MGLLKEIQNWLNEPEKTMAVISEFFGPTALGGLFGLFLSRGRSLGGGLLLAGGGAAVAAYLWKKYKDSLKEDKIKPPKRREPIAALPPGAPSLQSMRLARALVFAIRSNGCVSETEEAEIRKNIVEMRLGEDTETIIAQAMKEPREPGLVAEGLTNPEEALQLYLLSCTLIGSEPGPEQEYLKKLALALGIPEDMRMEIADDLRIP